MLSPAYSAERVLDELGVSDPNDLLLLPQIARARGAKVKERVLQGAEARLTVLGEKGIITVSSGTASPERKRFSIAHELGHFEMHRDISVVQSCEAKNIDWEFQNSSPDLEKQANEFASMLLLPSRFFAPLCKETDPSLDLIADLAQRFQVSLTATANRYLCFCDEPVALIFSESGHMKWFQGSRSFTELREDLGLYIDLRARLDDSTYAARLFRGNIAPRTFGRVRASAWFSSGEYSQEAVIQEQSWSMPAFNAVLTLLWIDEDLDEDDFDW